MASVDNKTFASAQSLSANLTTDSETLSQGDGDLIALLKLENAAGANISMDIEHSPDGVNWLTLDSVAALTADGVGIQRITNTAFPKVRAQVNVAAGSADVTAQLWFDPGNK